MSNSNVSVTVSPTLLDKTVYADGFARLSVKKGVVFLEFYQERQNADEIERIVTNKIVMPLSGLGELSQSIAAFEKEMRSRQDNIKIEPSSTNN